MVESERLKTELDTYLRHKDELVRESEGKYVVVHGDEVVGVWDTYEDALRAGYEKVGLEPFLVKQVRSIEQVHFFFRDLIPCRS